MSDFLKQTLPQYSFWSCLQTIDIEAVEVTSGAPPAQLRNVWQSVRGSLSHIVGWSECVVRGGPAEQQRAQLLYAEMYCGFTSAGDMDMGKRLGSSLIDSLPSARTSGLSGESNPTRNIRKKN
jgi:hypothetical protein